jgi:site-specific DNA-methyltransferase (adenine-specific)
VTVHHGDCVEVMAGMEPESVDAIVTDPPYGLEFMGKEWDRLQPDRSRPDPTGKSVSPFYRPGWGNSKTSTSTLDSQAWHQQWAQAAYRVAKPSAYLLAFGGTRTVHRMTVALEDAGWIIRDMLVWGYASGFPKSKASLKPAWEPIVMARKPGPLRMLAIDECRIPTDDPLSLHGRAATDNGWDPRWSREQTPGQTDGQSLGRWPANIVLTDPIFDGGVEGVVGGGEASQNSGNRYERDYGPRGLYGKDGDREVQLYGDSGTYSRFFLIPKAARSDREPVLGGLPLTEPQMLGAMGQGPRPQNTPHKNTPRANVHPTVKPTDLMRHLVRLVTPAGGTVLDPFGGSGTTALAAELEGYPWILIEREAEYVAIAEARLNGTQRGMAL